ncbi:rab-GTPase-TBC domain-containing protein [Dactylonectria macrodidyma]|uniref:GTPase-activating protein GYP5 n=1 Tax=Dactylonectria macrodidyma TaxID=307937 RepID=A0A9P9FA02_9HYPO|nr:rab-GTPase-TBC domain-containing protein [Dactylonectria macrodidyma]
MSQQEEVASAPIQADHKQQLQQKRQSQKDIDDKGDSSGTESSDDDATTEPDDFEDAVDASPVDTSPARSLTKRSASSTTKAVPSQDQPLDPASNKTPGPKDAKDSKVDKDEEEESDDSSEESSDDESIDERPPVPRKSSASHHRISNTSNLDNVSLDDEAPSPPPHTEPKDPEETQPPGKTLSIQNITSSFPSLPWSPNPESPSKSPAPPSAFIAPPPPPPPSQPAPPTRKLTSPFSWLSRNSSSKEKEPLPSPPTQPAGRRNTASSIATLMSNPEMMLSKLEEEKEGNSPNIDGAYRMSLRDRFKQLRLQQEGALPTGEENDNTEGTANGTGLGLITTGEELSAGEKPLPSPVPNPIPDLAPGTVSGVNAGPSAISESQVDWDLWQSVVYEGPAAVARTSAEELNRAIATGIPSAIRGVIWQVLTNCKNDELELVYKDLASRGTDKSKDRHSNGTTNSSISNGNLSVQSGDAITSSASSVNSDNSGPYPSPNTEKSSEAILKAQAAAAADRKRKEKEDAANLQKLEKVIRRDLGTRTSYSKYAAAAGLQEGLFGVCKAYALFDEGVGYAQGMNFLIMPLLFNMPEQEAFCLLVRLMNHYKLRDLFIQDMPGLHMHLYLFERLLEDFEPALYCHLHRRGISPHLYATQWFLTLFAYRFPLQLVLRIYDLILSEGLSAILRFGIVLMQKNASTLLGLSDMQQLTTYLKDRLFDVYIDKDPSHGSLLENGFFGSSSSSLDKEVYRADQLVKDACEVKITPEVLKAYTVEWEEKTKAEKDRENELQELRAANHNFAIRIRKMEERVEACDREQADLATELVRTKVENEELKDENESMKGQVRELRIVIEKQPEEIEETWKLERDDLMKRNGHVHEENQKLEKELTELEEELVSTKLLYAEINSQHETLNRKWTDLKRQFV